VKGGHIAEKIQVAKKAHEAVAGENLLQRIERRYKRLEQMATNAQKYGDPKEELMVYREERGFMDIEGKATGAFKEKIEHSGDMNLTREMSDEMVEELALKIVAKRKTK
jgi:ABC-type hemin transport system substrate-binding protein